MRSWIFFFSSLFGWTLLFEECPRSRTTDILKENTSEEKEEKKGLRHVKSYASISNKPRRQSIISSTTHKTRHQKLKGRATSHYSSHMRCKKKVSKVWRQDTCASFIRILTSSRGEVSGRQKKAINTRRLILLLMSPSPANQSTSIYIQETRRRSYPSWRTPLNKHTHQRHLVR